MTTNIVKCLVTHPEKTVYGKTLLQLHPTVKLQWVGGNEEGNKYWECGKIKSH